MALHIRLKPNERVILGDAVVRNGDGRADLWIENEVPVLREGDILPPDAARTPCGQVVLALQLLYVDPTRAESHATTYRELSAAVRAAAPSCGALLDEIEQDVAAGRPYQALKRSRRLLARETEILSHAR